MIRNIFLALLLSISGSVMAENLFIYELNKVSNRYVILDEQADSAVIYLSEVGSQRPAKDAFAYMRIKPIDLSTAKKRMEAGEPPVLHADIASKHAVILKTKKSDFVFKWSSNGESVALIYLNNPIAFISLNEKYGYSKAVIKESPIVNPWNEKLYENLFN